MSAIGPVVRSGVARAASLLPTAVATLVTSRLIIGHYGIGAFGSFALIVALIALIPLNDLGVGAAVTSAVAQHGPDSAYSRRVLLTSTRVLCASAAAVVVVSVLLGAAGAWPSLLGAASGPNAVVAVAMSIFALSFVPGLGQRMLLGVDRNHVTVIIQTFFTPLILVLVGAVVVLDLDPEWLLVVPPVALVVIMGVTAVVAVRATSFPWATLRQVPDRRRHPGESIRAISGPMLITTLAVPVMLQSDRIVLSHVSSEQALADYSVVIQIFAPLVALIAASAQPLWPIWARARAEGRPGPPLGRIVAIFGTGTALVCLVLVLVADPIGTAIGGDAIDLGWVLPIAAALSVTTQAVSYPVAMKLTDPAGVRLVAAMTLLALPLNVGLSIWFAKAYGAPGPLLATFLVGLFVQTLPALLFDRRRTVARADAPLPAAVAPRPRPRPGPAAPSRPQPSLDRRRPLPYR
ncbi:lipopolysaccharide biosynthesis protein [Jatrophihabitans fulvus]